MAAITLLVADQSPILTSLSSVPAVEDLWGCIAAQWLIFMEWASQPHILTVLLTWIFTCGVICTIILGLGFGPVGVAPQSCAAAFQSWMYGGFTPASGVFAMLTSMGMMGVLMPAVLVLAMVIATGVAWVVWEMGVGR